MFFLNPKHKTDELLPPPLPFPALEFEEEKYKPKAVRIKKAKVNASEKIITKPTKTKGFLGTKNTKRFLVKPKISKKEIKLAKTVPIKEMPIKRIASIKQKKSPIKKIKEKTSLPPGKISKKTKRSKPKEEIELPETLAGFGKEFERETKPIEILEAEEEIKSAIENIKLQEKTSFFNKLFAKRK